MNKFVYVLFLGGILMLWSCKGTKTTSQKTIKNDIVSTNTSKPQKFTAGGDSRLYEDASVIEKLQVILYLNNYQTGRINGEMTAETLRALAAFQQSNNLKVGDRSSSTLNALGVKNMDFDVNRLQEVLDRKGFDVGGIDGILGPKTRVAYQTFLRKNNLSGLGFSKKIKAVLMQNVENEENIVLEETENFTPPTPVTMKPASSKPTSIKSNVQVLQVQQALRRKGYDPGEMDGVLSQPMKDALFKYQVANELPVGGFNPDTLRSLGL
ncbi:MAG: peptidoglycan-binding protein [Chitinophagales bacterium]